MIFDSENFDKRQLVSVGTNKTVSIIGSVDDKRVYPLMYKPRNLSAIITLRLRAKKQSRQDRRER